MEQTISKALAMLKGERLLFATVVAMSVAASLIFVFYLDVVKSLIGAVVAADQTAALRWLLIGALALALETAMSSALIIVRKRFHCAALDRLRSAFFSKINTLCLPQVERYSQSDLSTRFLDDLTGIASFFSQDLIHLITNLALMVTMLSYIIIHEWRLLLVVVLALPVALFLTATHGKKLQSSVGELQQRLSERNMLAKDILDHPMEIKALRALPFFSRRFEDLERVLLASDHRRIYHRTIVWASSISLYHVIFLFFYGAGALFAYFGRVEYGVIIALYLMIDRLVDLLMGLPSMFTAIYEVQPKVVRVAEILELPHNELDCSLGTQNSAGDALVIKNLSYAYDTDRLILNGLSLTISPSERIAIIGESGCGKTTLLRLLAAYDTRYQGSVAILGRELRDWAPRELRQRIAYCPQQPFLMAKSILANFQAYFPDVRIDDLRRYARMVELDNEIEALPDQYATKIGQGGSNLSGGQRQRIGLMLGMIKKGDLLFIDEGLSAVDPSMAERILDKILAETSSTVIMVTHRLQESLMSRFDRIIVMSDGIVAAAGSHRDLMNHPVYQELYNKALHKRGEWQ